MNILFVHQNFPGQYLHIVRELSKVSGVKITSLQIEPFKQELDTTINRFRYGLNRGNTPNIHPWALETEAKVIRGEACGRAAHQLHQQGYQPDLICAHPGWGESLFLRQIWPNVPILHYQEFFYNTSSSDLDFDPELQKSQSWETKSKSYMKNAAMQLALESSSWNVCPTKFQKSTFPEKWQKSISVIHDGIDTNIARPKKIKGPLKLTETLSINQGEPIVTFVNRTLEPYRGCHTFIRAIPEIQRLCPKAKIVIVGKTKGVSYGAACTDGEWKDRFLKEINGKYDPNSVHFTGSLPYESYLQLLQVSKAHVYLTYPFVLSWSLLEAMSIECPIVGSATDPVKELIQHNYNGLLVDFFNHQELAENVSTLLKNPELAQTLGSNARKTILKDYSLEQCVPRQIALMNMVACGALQQS